MNLFAPKIKLPEFSEYVKSKLGIEKFNEIAEYVSDVPFDRISTPEKLQRDFSITVSYGAAVERRFRADQNYKISDCGWHDISKSGTVTTGCIIDDSRSSAQFTARAEKPNAWAVGTVSLGETRVRD